jgi:hypothetical protein
MAGSQRPVASRGHGGTPEATRQLVMAALLSGLSTDAAATAHGLDGTTVRRWLADDVAFRAEYDERLASLKARTDDALHAARVTAINSLTLAAQGGDVTAAAALLRTLPTKGELHLTTTTDETAARLAAAIAAKGAGE